MGDEKDRICPEGGVCHLHDSEIERRKLTNDEISAIKGRIGELLTFKNKAIGFTYGIGVFATIVILGSYTYTFHHTQQADQEYAKLAEQTRKVDDENKSLRRDIQATNVQLARNDERYQALQNQLRSIDGRLEQLLSKLNNR